MATASWEIQICAVPSHGMFPMRFPLEWHSYGQACKLCPPKNVFCQTKPRILSIGP